MDTSKFQQARLIPTIGIKGEEEQERRTTSAFLAVLVAVPEFSKALLKGLGAPAGKVTTYIEPEFVLDNRKVRPDGLIVVERGATLWSALVEVKTGKNPLKTNQLNDYLDIARSNGVNALLTISNEVLTLTGEHPTAGLDNKKIKKTALVHYSWIRILTEALMQKEHRGVSDPDQAWILGELIRYLQHPASGALEFNEMGQGWVPVRQGIMNGTLSANDPQVTQVVNSYESLMQFLALRLSAKLGVHVTEVAPKIAQIDPKKHTQQEVTEFLKNGCLVGALRVPNTVSDLKVVADIRAAQVRCSVEVTAPKEGRNLTRVNWLLRQLKTAPHGLKIETRVKRGGTNASIASMFADAQSDPTKLVPTDSREIFTFTLTLIEKLGTKQGDGNGSFIETVVGGVETAYQVMLENLKEWTPKAPRLGVPELDDTNSPFDPVGPDMADVTPLKTSRDTSHPNIVTS